MLSHVDAKLNCSYSARTSRYWAFVIFRLCIIIFNTLLLKWSRSQSRIGIDNKIHVMYTRKISSALEVIAKNGEVLARLVHEPEWKKFSSISFLGKLVHRTKLTSFWIYYDKQKPKFCACNCMTMANAKFKRAENV